MKSNPRIHSIIGAENLNAEITGYPSFDLQDLKVPIAMDFVLPDNLRLGHLVERVVVKLLNASKNYEVLFENIQVIENKRTIGEIDLILRNATNSRLIHLELAYKFYLYDPEHSEVELNNWIGPNRNDSMFEKIEKLHNKQFPLIKHRNIKELLSEFAQDDITQRLCFMISLFVPYAFTGTISPAFQKAIIGYYLGYQTFLEMDHKAKRYFIPSKTNWGIEPIENKRWLTISEIKEDLELSIVEKRSLLCWQKQKEMYTSFFIVWW